MDATQSHSGRTGRRIALALVLALVLVAAAVVRSLGGEEPALRVAALDGSTVRLAFTAPGDATAVELTRDGRLLDRFALEGSDGVWTDRLLWEGGRYAYVARFLEGGRELARRAATATTPRGRELARRFAGDAWVNRALDASAAIDAGSAAMVAGTVAPAAASANLANSHEWGIPIAYAGEGSNREDVRCERFTCDVAVAPHRIPAYAGPNDGSDRHLAVIDAAAGTELDMWLARREGDGWAAGSRWVLRVDGGALNCATDGPCGGAIAANLPLTAGVVAPEEIARGRIDHALAITVPTTRSGPPACPAAGSDGSAEGPGAIPIGARLRLDPAVDVAALGLAPWQAVLARALQAYGAVVVDTGGSLAVRAESTALRGYDAWSRAGVPADDPSLSALPWDRLQVLALQSCPDRG